MQIHINKAHHGIADIYALGASVIGRLLKHVGRNQDGHLTITEASRSEAG